MKRNFIVDSYNTRRTGGLPGGDLLHVPALRGAKVLQGAPHAPVLQVVHIVHTTSQPVLRIRANFVGYPMDGFYNIFWSWFWSIVTYSLKKLSIWYDIPNLNRVYYVTHIFGSLISFLGSQNCGIGLKRKCYWIRHTAPIVSFVT